VAANLSIFLVADDSSGSLGKRTLQLVAATVIGGNVASFILIALVITAYFELSRPSPPRHVFTEAFYYATMSAALYFITSAFTVYTAYMIWPGRHSYREASKIQLAKGHHKLMLLTVLFMAYILIGAAVFSHIEGWGYLDAVFWADVTILTIGFGDFKPSTHLGRSLLFPYAVCGIIILFLVVYCIPKLVFDRGKSMWEIHLRDQERIKRVQQREEQERKKEATYYGLLWRNRASEEETAGVQHSNAVRAIEALSSGSKEVKKSEEREARRRDFKLMQDILLLSARKRLGYSVTIWLSCSLLLWLAGAAIFFVSERPQRWTYFEAVYFAFAALLVIGYGDFTLQSRPAKAFFVLWSLIAVPTLTMLISTTAEAVGNPYLFVQKDWVKRKILGKKAPKKQQGLSGWFIPLFSFGEFPG
jgi:potassium channel subfamily K, other eukaryote